MPRRPKDYRQAVILYAEGMPLPELAARYGITPQGMWQALRARGVANRRYTWETTLNHREMSPEHALIAALLRVAVNDAKSRAQAASSDGPRIAEAQAWLRNREAVMFWIELANLPDTTYDALLREAGLEGEQ